MFKANCCLRLPDRVSSHQLILIFLLEMLTTSMQWIQLEIRRSIMMFIRQSDNQ